MWWWKRQIVFLSVQLPEPGAGWKPPARRLCCPAVPIAAYGDHLGLTAVFENADVLRTGIFGLHIKIGVPLFRQTISMDKKAVLANRCHFVVAQCPCTVVQLSIVTGLLAGIGINAVALMELRQAVNDVALRCGACTEQVKCFRLADADRNGNVLQLRSKHIVCSISVGIVNAQMHSNGIASRSLNVHRFPAGDLRQKQGFAAVLIISDQIGNRIFQIILRFFQFESIPFGNEKAAEKTSAEAIAVRTSGSSSASAETGIFLCRGRSAEKGKARQIC